MIKHKQITKTSLGLPEIQYIKVGSRARVPNPQAAAHYWAVACFKQTHASENLHSHEWWTSSCKWRALEWRTLVLSRKTPFPWMEVHAPALSVCTCGASRAIANAHHSCKWSFMCKHKHSPLMHKAPFPWVEGACTCCSHQWTCVPLMDLCTIRPVSLLRAGPPIGKLGNLWSRELSWGGHFIWNVPCSTKPGLWMSRRKGDLSSPDDKSPLELWKDRITPGKMFLQWIKSLIIYYFKKLTFKLCLERNLCALQAVV